MNVHSRIVLVQPKTAGESLFDLCDPPCVRAEEVYLILREVFSRVEAIIA